MKQKVKEALIYPLITLLVGAVVIVILVVGIIPMFEDIYSRGGFELPLVTKILEPFSTYRSPFLTAFVLIDAASLPALGSVSANAARISPEEIYDLLPLRFPMTHLLQKDGKTVPGVARYPLSEWKQAGFPVPWTWD